MRASQSPESLVEEKGQEPPEPPLTRIWKRQTSLSYQTRSVRFALLPSGASLTNSHHQLSYSQMQLLPPSISRTLWWFAGMRLSEIETVLWGL